MKELTVAEFLTARIRMSGKSLVEISREIGLPHANFLSMVRKGKARVPLNRIPKLATALHVEPQSLLFRCLKEYDQGLLEVIYLCLPGAFLSDADLALLEEVKKKLALLRSRRRKT